MKDEEIGLCGGVLYPGVICPAIIPSNHYPAGSGVVTLVCFPGVGRHSNVAGLFLFDSGQGLHFQ